MRVILHTSFIVDVRSFFPSFSETPETQKTLSVQTMKSVFQFPRLTLKDVSYSSSCRTNSNPKLLFICHISLHVCDWSFLLGFLLLRPPEGLKVMISRFPLSPSVLFFSPDGENLSRDATM